jgi:hypothetical protein
MAIIKFQDYSTIKPNQFNWKPCRNKRKGYNAEAKTKSIQSQTKTNYQTVVNVIITSSVWSIIKKRYLKFKISKVRVVQHWSGEV